MAGPTPSFPGAVASPAEPPATPAGDRPAPNRRRGSGRPRRRPASPVLRGILIGTVAGLVVLGMAAALVAVVDGPGGHSGRATGSDPGSHTRPSLANVRRTRGPYPATVVSLPVSRAQQVQAALQAPAGGDDHPAPATPASVSGRSDVVATVPLPNSGGDNHSRLAGYRAGEPIPLPGAAFESLFQSQLPQTEAPQPTASTAATTPPLATTDTDTVSSSQPSVPTPIATLTMPGQTVSADAGSTGGVTASADLPEAMSDTAPIADAVPQSTSNAASDPALATADQPAGTVPPADIDAEAGAAGGVQLPRRAPPEKGSPALIARINTAEPPRRGTGRPARQINRPTYEAGVQEVDLASLSRPDPAHRPPPDAEMIMPSATQSEFFVVSEQDRFIGVWLHTPRLDDDWEPPTACRYWIKRARQLKRFVDQLHEACDTERVRMVNPVQAARLGRARDGSPRLR